jgi:hypothetical protein
MQLKVHANDPGRYILDSKPLVLNVDGYCERVNGVSGRHCETRLEGDPQRTACDYLAVGKAPNGRWGPQWYRNNQLCDGANAANCRDHGDNQFMAIAKAPGFYEACAASTVRVDPDGSLCGPFDLKSVD